MNTNLIIGTYTYQENNSMGIPRIPIRTTLDKNAYSRWVAAYDKKYTPALEALQKKIIHVSYSAFERALEVTLNKFQTANVGIRCVSLVEPDKSQKWVTEIAIQKGFRATAYINVGEEGANALDFALQEIEYNDQRFTGHYIIIDDGSYSGNQMANNISQADKILQNKFDVKPTFHVLLPFITDAALERIQELKSKKIKVKLYTSEIMPSIEQSIEAKHLPLVKEVLWQHFDKNERDRRAHSTPLYWFDHKIPNAMSFPETLALGIVTCPKNKAPTDNIPFIPDVLPPYKGGKCVDVNNNNNNNNNVESPTMKPRSPLMQINGSSSLSLLTIQESKSN